ncbi:hypothetical protein U1Q18_051781 [Sarracenia purpurea var. burkii]
MPNFIKTGSSSEEGGYLSYSDYNNYNDDDDTNGNDEEEEEEAVNNGINECNNSNYEFKDDSYDNKKYGDDIGYNTDEMHDKYDDEDGPDLLGVDSIESLREIVDTASNIDSELKEEDSAEEFAPDVENLNFQ